MKNEVKEVREPQNRKLTKSDYTSAIIITLTMLIGKAILKEPSQVSLLKDGILFFILFLAIKKFIKVFIQNR